MVFTSIDLTNPDLCESLYLAMLNFTLNDPLEKVSAGRKRTQDNDCAIVFRLQHIVSCLCRSQRL